MCGNEEPDPSAHFPTKRKIDDVDCSTPTPPVSTTQTNTETVSMDDDTTSAEPEEEIEDCGDDTKKEKKKRVYPKHECKWSGCNVIKNSPGELKAHVEFIHEKFYRNVCDHIDKGTKCECKFERPVDLERHNKIHSDVRDYPCPDCPAVFNRPDHLKQHTLQTHSDDRDHKCTVCSMAFKTAQTRDDHWAACAPKNDKRRLAFLEAANQRKREKRTKERAERDAFWAKNGGAPSKFGEIDGVSRDEEIAALIGSPAGALLGSSGEATVATWIKRHGNTSLIDVLSNRVGNSTFAVYFWTTMQTVTPGEEEKCPESIVFLHDVQRNPLWRIETDTGDLRRFTYAEAASVCETYVLKTSDNRYDITSLEGEAQYYIEDLGVAHGVRLHQQAGAGSRLPGSETEYEKKRRANGEKIIYSLAVTLIETHNQVFADEIDPKDPTPTLPRLLSATVVGNKNGKEMVFNVVVRGHKKPFRDAPSVLADQKEVKRLNKNNAAVKKKRHAARKLATTTPNQGTKGCIQEPSKKKQKKVAVQMVP
ncbi:hypothetical protein T484DRAFT_1747591 [Baffinella frigidus]|nr:hypothetical protein T484DRAFT_1747591 [Cryptophyta sp. CCMP2293]